MNDTIRILLVEDDPSDQKLIRSALENGLEYVDIEITDNRDDIKQALTAKIFDIILTDYDLKGFTGFDVFDDVRKFNRHIPIIMLTGEDDEEIVIEALKKEFDDYVKKSLKFIKLLPAKIVKLLAKSDVDTPFHNSNRFISAFDHSSIAYAIGDQYGFILAANKTGLNLLGYEKDELIGKNFLEIVHPEERDVTSQDYMKLFTGESHGYNIDRRYLHKQGHPIWCDCHISLITNTDGNPPLALVQAKDINARKLAEDKFNGLLESAPDAIIIINENCEIELINNQAEKLFGYSREDLSGEKVEILIPQGISDSIPALGQAAVVKPEEQIMEGADFELFAVDKRGRPFPVDITLSKFETQEGLFISIGVRDITERKQMLDSLRESKEKFVKAFNSSPDAIAIMTLNEGHIIDVNRNHEKISGFSRESLIGKSMFELDIWANGRDRFKFIKTVKKNGTIRNWEVDLRSRDGVIKHCLISAEKITIKNEPCIVGIIRDVTAQTHATEKLRESNERFLNSFKYAAIGMWLGDKDGTIKEVNPSVCKMIGYSESELIGKNYKEFTHLDDVEISNNYHEKLFSGKMDNYRLVKHYRHKDGHYIWADVSVALVRTKDGTPDYDIVHVIDVTREKEISEELSYHASHDALTDLINRREFERRAERLLSTIKIDKHEHALCYMDLDQFKLVNDTCGHVAGDELLRQLSTLLKNTVRKRDTLARLGGDEFGILMEHCSLDHAHRVSKSLQKEIQDYQFSWEGHSFKVGVSMGLIAITESAGNLIDLLRNADSACYMAKDAGRNRIHIYRSEDSRAAKRHGDMQWVERLHKALEEDRFCLYAQTISPLGRSKDKHYELLLRMIDEQGMIISPGSFLPAAELYNLMSKLDSFVVERTFHLLADNPRFCKQVNFCSINLSGQSLAESTFLSFVITQLNESGIDGDKICFEITETAAISNIDMATKFISTLRGLGCKFALDDFGSGLSSFGYLKNLPVDYLKIDGMFVRNIVNDPIDHAMVKSINEIGHVMGMQTIAEFVENDEIKGMLREIGVNYAQGYAIDKPQPFNDLLDRSSNVTNIKIAAS